MSQDSPDKIDKIYVSQGLIFSGPVIFKGGKSYLGLYFGH